MENTPKFSKVFSLAIIKIAKKLKISDVICEIDNKIALENLSFNIWFL